MAKGKARDLGLEQRWRRILQRQQRSGLSVRAFCRGEDLAETAFGFWKRELRRRDQEASSAFVELAPIAGTLPAEQVPLELQVGQRRLLLRPGCDLELLGRVVQTLEGLR